MHYNKHYAAIKKSNKRQSHSLTKYQSFDWNFKIRQWMKQQWNPIKSTEKKEFSEIEMDANKSTEEEEPWSALFKSSCKVLKIGWVDQH